MPYGVDKDMGGDNKNNDAWMERCVMRVMKGGKDKGSAIAICKTTLQKMHGDTKKADFAISTLLGNKDIYK
jgi:ribosomal protein S7